MLVIIKRKLNNLISLFLVGLSLPVFVFKNIVLSLLCTCARTHTRTHAHTHTHTHTHTGKQSKRMMKVISKPAKMKNPIRLRDESKHKSGCVILQPHPLYFLLSPRLFERPDSVRLGMVSWNIDTKHGASMGWLNLWSNLHQALGSTSNFKGRY